MARRFTFRLQVDLQFELLADSSEEAHRQAHQAIDETFNGDVLPIDVTGGAVNGQLWKRPQVVPFCTRMGEEEKETPTF